MIESLLLCDVCSHGAGYHTGYGCECQRCSCPKSKHQLVEENLDQVRDEIASTWRVELRNRVNVQFQGRPDA